MAYPALVYLLPVFPAAGGDCAAGGVHQATDCLVPAPSGSCCPANRYGHGAAGSECEYIPAAGRGP